VSNLFFQTWTAEKISRGDRLIVSSHGGAIPDKYSMFKHEEHISYKKVIWNIPYCDNHVQMSPTKFSRNNDKVISGDKLLLIGFELSVYSNRCQSGPISSLYSEVYKKNIEFCSLLKTEPFENLRIKPNKHTGTKSGWNTYQRFLDDLTTEKFLSISPLSNIINTSKIIVCTYPQTAFFESMQSGVPTILLYLEKYWETETVFDELIESMKKAKIIFTDSKVAANHVNTIWNNPIKWWKSEKVLAVRENFHDKCGRINPDWLNEWSSFFLQEIKE
jgi:putative transferase (TIGR04331 family)